MLCSLLPLLMACSGGATAVTGPGDSPSGTDASLQRVEVQPSELTLQVGESARLTIHGRDDEGQEVSLSARDVDWTSSAPGVASVDSTGLVSALGDGNVSIAARVNPNASDQSMRDSALVIAEPRSGGGGTAGDPGDPTNAFRAFPGAEGWGAEALTQCDRSHLQVLHVTNLQDSGAGSLRDAIERVQGGILSIILFDVAGYIDLSSRIPITTSCLYIAGQTAPGDGITIRTGSTGLALRSGVHDVVIRHLRFRAGYHGEKYGHVNVAVTSGYNIMLDHLSLGWTTDKLLIVSKFDGSFSQPMSRITVQRTLLHEALAAHPTAVQITPPSGNWETADISEVTLHHNLFANNSHRNPAAAIRDIRLVNNVVYNWNQAAHQVGGRVDVVNSYFRGGPMTTDRLDREISSDCDTTNEWSMYAEGNIGPNNQDPSADNWEGDSRMIGCYYKTGDGAGTQIPDYERYRRSSPIESGPVPVSLQSATDAYSSVLDDVGATSRLRCDGSVADERDAVDRRIISEVINRTGVSSPPETEEDVGGYPPIDPGTPCADQDGDGMPDEYERQWGFDPSDATDSWSDADGDGYLNIEEYLNASRPM